MHNGDAGDVACDHNHRMPVDVELLKSLDVDTYRFSVAWPRIQPNGRGKFNEAGMAFYDRLVDRLFEKGTGRRGRLALARHRLPVRRLFDAGVRQAQ